MDRLKEILAQIDKQQRPPVDKWHPEHLGKIDIRIDTQGFWFHEGDPISREKLVRLFASILWFERDDEGAGGLNQSLVTGRYYLITPVEKLAIVVEDVPFVVHQMEYVEDTWVAVTNTHEQLVIGQEHRVELRPYLGQLVPYVRVRYDLWARVNRSIYYQWVTAAMQDQSNDNDLLLLSSAGFQFEVARVS
ncbi:MAG: hypothetical protein ACI9XU_001016 [Arenicella sp.]|jgi:hypothetical protein